MKITMGEFVRRGGAAWGSEDFQGVENLVELGEQRWGKNFMNRGFMHTPDHVYALRVVFDDREPTWLEVMDSWVRGSHYIDLARAKTDTGPDPNWDAETLRLYRLIKKYGMARGQRIFDGLERDPDSDVETPPPPPPPPPVTGLSAPEQRAEELASLVAPIYTKIRGSIFAIVLPRWEVLWPLLKPLVVELVLSIRRTAARRA